MMHRSSLFAEKARPLLGWFLAFALSIVPPAWAMSELEEADMGEVTGEGLAFPFESLRFQMAPTSFIELTGSSVSTCTAPNTPAGCTYLKRGDVRYYGLAMSRGSTRTGVETYTIDNTGGMDWAGNGCTAGTYGLGCPMTSYGIANYSNVDNPYVLRAFEYNAMGPGGLNVNQTVLEFLGPSNTDLFRWAFWGEIESDRGGATQATLQSQSIILGKPTAWLKPPSLVGTAPATNSQQGSVFRLFQYQGDQSLGLTYTSRLSGDFRFSVNQTATSPNLRQQVPDFSDREGLYFRNVNAFLPLGQLNYQAITLNDTQTGSGGVATNGNFVVELAAIPGIAGIYNDFYSLPTALAPVTGCDAACQTANRGYNRVTSAIPARYYETHGYVEWGDKFPTCGFSNCMSGTGVSQVRFSGVDPDGPTVAITNTIRACDDGDGCRWTGSVGNVFSSTASAVFNTSNTTDQVIGAGGVSFVSRATGSTWTVLHNQNLPRREYNQVNTAVNSNGTGANDMMQRNTYGCGFLGLANCTEFGPRNYAADYNPAISVNAINLGSSRIEGFQINHLKITSLGAN